jgi:hypothetical protein
MRSRCLTGDSWLWEAVAVACNGERSDLAGPALNPKALGIAAAATEREAGPKKHKRAYPKGCLGRFSWPPLSPV